MLKTLAQLPAGYIATLAGHGFREGVPAKEADIGWPMGVVRRPDGDILFADIRAHRIWRVDLAPKNWTIVNESSPAYS